MKENLNFDMLILLIFLSCGFFSNKYTKIYRRRKRSVMKDRTIDQFNYQIHGVPWNIGMHKRLPRRRNKFKLYNTVACDAWPVHFELKLTFWNVWRSLGILPKHAKYTDSCALGKMIRSIFLNSIGNLYHLNWS